MKNKFNNANRIISISNDFPFHQCTIFSPNRIQILIIIIKLHSHNMRTMSPEATWF